MKTLLVEIEIDVEEKDGKFFLFNNDGEPTEVGKELFEFLLKVGDDVTPKYLTLEQLGGTWEIIDGVPVVTYITSLRLEVSKCVKETKGHCHFTHEGKNWIFID